MNFLGKKSGMNKQSISTSQGHLCNESLALLDVLLEIGQAGSEELLFLSRELANRVDLLNTVQLERGRNG
jgi:hypothetical protein